MVVEAHPSLSAETRAPPRFAPSPKASTLPVRSPGPLTICAWSANPHTDRYHTGPITVRATPERSLLPTAGARHESHGTGLLSALHVPHRCSHTPGMQRQRAPSAAASFVDSPHFHPCAAKQREPYQVREGEGGDVDKQIKRAPGKTGGKVPHAEPDPTQIHLRESRGSEKA